jgi:signal transduction histidine kinase
MSDLSSHPTSGRRHRSQKHSHQDLTTVQGLRRRLLRLTLWPPIAVMALVSAGAWLLFHAPSRPVAWAACALAVAGCAGVLVTTVRRVGATAAMTANSTTANETVSGWLTRLHAVVTEGNSRLELPAEPAHNGWAPEPQSPESPEPLCVDAQFEAVENAVRQYQYDLDRAISQTAGRQQRQVLVGMARRLQTLVIRTSEELDLVERDVEDPEVMTALFRVDDLVSRVRRAVECLVMLGDAVPRRITEDLPVQTMLRCAVTQIERYQQVRLLQVPSCQIVGHAGTTLIHLLAELIAHATQISPPEAAVHITAEQVPEGLAIKIDDQGLVASDEWRAQANEVLTAPDLFDLTTQLGFGRVGLYVVAQLAKRHDISVRIQTNLYGGNQVAVLLPDTLLTSQFGTGLAVLSGRVLEG